MSNKPSHRGAHKYQRFKQGNGALIWRCLLNCPHFLRRDMILGRESICHRCGDTFIMDKHAIELVKPHCRNCTKHRNEVEQTVELLPEESPL